MSDREPRAVPISEQAQNLRDHYKEAAAAVSHWCNQIPVAIDLWEQKKLAESEPTGQPGDVLGYVVVSAIKMGWPVSRWEQVANVGTCYQDRDTAQRFRDKLAGDYPNNRYTVEPVG